MSKIEELIKELCPNGVKYKNLNEVCSINTGKQLNKTKLLDNAKYPVINGGILPSGYWNEFNTEKNTITISQGGASAGYVNYMQEDFWAGAHCYVVKLIDKDINYRFLYHFIKSKEKELQQSQQGAGIPGLNRQKVYDLKIPVPQLEVQCEIVHILDNFTLLISELTVELAARQKQYEYYREKILYNHDNNIIKLENCCKILDNIRKPIKKSLRENGKYPYYGANGIQDYVNDYIFDGKYILVGEDGTVITNKGNPIVTWAEGKIWVNNHAHVIKENGNINLRYLYYYLKVINISNLVHGNIPKLNQNDLKNLEILVPPIEEQERIVSILDRFDKLCNDTSEGLPAEIEARQKQYEYYRDKLLTFKELNVEE